MRQLQGKADSKAGELHALRVPRLWLWLLPSLLGSAFALLAWPITVSVTLSNIRDFLLTQAPTSHTNIQVSSKEVAVRPGVAYFLVVAAFFLQLAAALLGAATLPVIKCGDSTPAQQHQQHQHQHQQVTQVMQVMPGQQQGSSVHMNPVAAAAGSASANPMQLGATNPMAAKAPNRPVWVPVKPAGGGDTYYHNTLTGETAWELPAEAS
jgi:hypothetical protein